MNSSAELIPLRVPQSGPNDTHAMFAEWSKPSGSWVTKGEVVAVAETTKSVFDIEAPVAGYLTTLAAPGAEVAIGEVIGVLAPTVVSVEAVDAWLAATATPASQVSAEPVRSWTKKAELLAERHKIDINQVPATGDRVTEADVEAYIATRGATTTIGKGIEPTVNDTVDDRYPANRAQRLLIIGGGNGAIQIIDALQGARHQRAVAVLDDNRAIHGKHIAGVPVLGAIDTSWAVDQLANGLFDAAVISISTSISFRERVFNEWKGRGIPFANVIHPSAVIGMNVTWGEGNVVMALCHFGACATVGDNNFLSAYCSIEHHCVLGSHCSFGPSVVTSSRVRFGDRVRCGTGIYIEPGVTIGADSIIASGLAIWQNIPERSLLKAHLGYSIRGR